MFSSLQNKSGAEPGVMGFVGPNEGDETSQYAAIAEGHNIPYVSNSETSMAYSDKVRKNFRSNVNFCEIPVGIYLLKVNNGRRPVIFIVNFERI